MEKAKQTAKEKLEYYVRRDVTPELMQALEEYYEAEKNTFLFRTTQGLPIAPDYETMVLMASSRDGQLSVLRQIKAFLKKQ